MRKTDARLLEYSAIDEDPALSPTPGFTLPVIVAKLFLAVDAFERLNDSLLQRFQVFIDLQN
jgi:hypothetical protein